MSDIIALKGVLVRSVVAAGGIAVAALIVTAPVAGASVAKDICKEMGGKLSTEQNRGSTYESCSVQTGGGEVVGTWVNGQWQGTVSPSDGNPGPGHKYVPINHPTPQ
jgi:hypothetical protein